MALATYTGKLVDCGLVPLGPGLAPSASVRPVINGFAPSGPIVSRGVPVDLASDGSFSMTLIQSVDLIPPSPYELTVKWLDAAGNFVQQDTFIFTAHPGGGPISDGALQPVGRIWWATYPPPNPVVGIAWVHTDTWDVEEWL